MKCKRHRPPKYSGRFKRLPLIRIGKKDAEHLLMYGEKWELRKGVGSAYELIDSHGFARYWLARRAAEEILAAMRQRGAATKLEV